MVSAPYGIDLARQVSIDIGLEPGNNDWIDVTFLWTKGWEGGSEDGSTSQGSVPEVIVPVETATPMPDGSIIHEVQQGQAPLHIAKAYAVELSQLFELNELTFDSIIQPGDKLVVQPAQKSLTPSPDISLERVEVHDDVKVTSNPTRTPVPKTDTPKATIIATSDSAQPKPNDSSITQQLISRTQRLGVDIILIVIVVLIFVGSVLLLFGRSMKGKP
jgi:LysM repeat protein